MTTEYLIVIAIGVVSILALIARFNAGVAAHRARGRIVLHYPAPGAAPMALVALTEPSLIVDRAVARALARGARGQPPEAGDAEIVSRVRSLTDPDLRVGTAVADALGAGTRVARQLPLTVPYGGSEFAAMVARLEGCGVPDAVVVAEALLASCNEGVVPALLTTDRTLLERLPRSDAPIAETPSPYRGTAPPMASAVVTFEGRSLRVVPIGA